MSELKIHNTLTGKKEIFKPVKKGEVKMYVCGPTVNDVPHLGHARQQITFDVLRKYLKYSGYKVKFVSNVTDIEDKIINKARELGEDISSLTKRNMKAHAEDYAAIGIEKPDVQPKATEYVKEMIALVEKLDKKGFAYVIEGDGVYYDVSRFKEYGKLSKQKIENLQAGKRVSAEGKRGKEDFVLWKFSKPGEPSWNAPWGSGRPGWHLECSAMSEKVLGLPLDIHGGGQDLTFPHHEDEIAQSEAAYGKKLANFWVHNGMINVEKVKMSKSLGNFRTIRDILKDYPGAAVRYFVLSANYRKPLDFSIDNLDAAKNAYEKLKRKIVELKEQKHKGKDSSEEYDLEFRKAMDDDLNTTLALSVVWKAVDDFDFAPAKKIKLLEKFDEVLGLGIKEMKEEELDVPKEVKELVAQREGLRKNKKWKESDIVRDKILEKGFVVQDTESGPRILKS